jgi:putative flippase GtrA
MQSIISLVRRYELVWWWAIVGVINFVIDYLIFIGMYLVNTSVLVSSFVAGLFSITLNYFTIYFWSFKSQADHSKSGI